MSLEYYYKNRDARRAYQKQYRLHGSKPFRGYRKQLSHEEKERCRRIKMAQAVEIRKLYSSGMSGPKLAAEFGVHSNTIYRIINEESHT